MSLRRSLAAFGILAGLSAPALGQTNWQPTAGGVYTWNNPANWLPAVVPLSGTVNVTSDITGDQTISLDVQPNLTVLNVGDPSPPLVAPGSFGFAIVPGAGGAFTFSGASAALTSNNGANSITAPITLGGNLTVTHANTPGAAGPSTQAGSLTLGGPIDLGANTLTVGLTASSLGRLDRGVVIGGVISGAGGLAKTAGNFLLLTGANTYAGPTAISSGAIRLAGTGTLGGGNLALSGNGQLFPAGTTFTRPIGTAAGQVQLTGTGGFGTIDQDLTVNFNGDASPVVWGAAGFTPTQFGLSSTSSTGTVTVLNPIDLNGATREVRADNGTAAVDVILSGAVSGAAGFTKSGDGTLVLPVANSYTGVTLLGANGALRVQDPAALGTTAGATTVLGATRTNRLELAGGISVAEPIQLEGRTTGTNLTPAVSSFSGANTLTANIIPFNVAAAGVEYNVHVNTGATFTLTGTFTNTLGTGTVTRNLNLLGGGTGAFNGVISSGAGNDAVAVVKRDAGTWTLSGANGYTGGTTVVAGALRVSGQTGTASGTGTGPVAVNSGGTFGGTGRAAGAVTVNSGGTLAPGVGNTGTLLVGAAVTFTSGSVFRVGIAPGANPAAVNSGGSAAPDAGNTFVNAGTNPYSFTSPVVLVDVTGVAFTEFAQYSFQVGQGTSIAAGAGPTPVAGAIFVFVNNGVDVTGLFLNTAPTLTFDPGQNNVYLNFSPVPEPTGLLAAAAALGAAGRRLARRRAAELVG